MSESNALPPRYPHLGSQSGRQNLGVSPYSRPASAPKTSEPAPETASAGAPSAPSSDGTKGRLTTFLSKLETTWQLFNKGTREGDQAAQPRGKPAYLDEKDVPTPASLRELRARTSGGSEYLSKGTGPASSGGPKESPLSDRTTSKAPTSRSAPGGGEPASAPRPGRAAGSLPPSFGGDKAGATRTAGWQPTGAATSRSFLASATMAGARLRESDAAGGPGGASRSEAQALRQPLFSQSLAQVNPRVTARQVSSQMPIHNGFLDERHGKESGNASSLQLSWGGGKKPATPGQSAVLEQSRLRFGNPANGTAGGAAPWPNPLSLHNSAAVLSARSDIAARFAGKAIHSLLKKLYDEEDLEELDEEKAVSGLGLILRLGGEFTYEHSTRVLDLALALADEVGIKDKTTRKEIRFGTSFRDVGELDALLGGDSGSGDAKLGQLGEFLGGQDMLRAGLLHDIGKVNIPAEILYKPGKLTAEEYEIMKQHPIWGEEIVRPIASLRYLCPTIRGHHERWDGKGYPDGLSGEAIPVAARIISVADVFDALSAERPYKRGMEVQKVIAILAEGRGSHFDPALVDSFLAIIDRRYPEEPASLVG